MSPGAGGLRTTELRVIPRVVQRGRNVTLACLYDLQDYGVYSVKWYKGTQEFYRYSPVESPSTRVSNVAGIKVDVSISYFKVIFIITVTRNCLQLIKAFAHKSLAYTKVYYRVLKKNFWFKALFFFFTHALFMVPSIKD